jgi:hypothetical protein
MTELPPCRHHASTWPSRCLIGRAAPRDCGLGCAGYSEDLAAAISLDPAERTRCEIWTRVMGYHRPVSAFNPGKQSEHAERLHFRETGAATVAPLSGPPTVAASLDA